MLDGNDLHNCASDTYDVISSLQTVKDDLNEESKNAKYSCEIERIENINEEVTQIMDNLDLIAVALSEIGDEVDDYINDSKNDSDLGEEYEDI